MLCALCSSLCALLLSVLGFCCCCCWYCLPLPLPSTNLHPRRALPTAFSPPSDATTPPPFPACRKINKKKTPRHPERLFFLLSLARWPAYPTRRVFPRCICPSSALGTRKHHSRVNNAPLPARRPTATTTTIPTTKRKIDHATTIESPANAALNLSPPPPSDSCLEPAGHCSHST